MASFQYIARTVNGQEVTGLMQAENESAVVRALDEKKLFPVQVTPQVIGRRSLGGQKIRIRDLALLYGQLADLLRAGVPLLRSLETLGWALTNRRLAELVTLVRQDVSQGQTLADAMSQRPAAFSPLHCAMVRAGERAGFLEDVLVNLSQFLERQDELRGKVRGALIYPAVLVIIGSIVLTLVLVFLVPQFRNFFKGSLPLPTEVLFGLSDLIRDHALMLVGAIVVAVLGVRTLLQSQWGLQTYDRLKLRVPLMGRAILMVDLTRFCRILGTMLANGVPILQSLAISKDAAGSMVLAKSIEQAAENVRAGQGLSAPLHASGLFPAEIVEMISVAEESNQLEKVLVQIADTVEKRMARQVDYAVRLVEPLILVVMAAIVGFVAFGLLYPLFTMSQAIVK
jgi:type II secretory pathway component PulF